MKAAVAGVVVGLAGAAVWYGVRVVTDYELGLLSIAIGYGVGKAVSWGSSGRGGWLYQLLAVVLTYAAICANYVPDIVQAAVGEGGVVTLPLVLLSLPISLTVPFLMGTENIIGMLIIAFGLYEAGKLNKRVDATITGPYAVTASAVPAVAPPANV
jgi:hypothetical protein